MTAPRVKRLFETRKERSGLRRIVPLQCQPFDQLMLLVYPHLALRNILFGLSPVTLLMCKLLILGHGCRIPFGSERSFRLKITIVLERRRTMNTRDIIVIGGSAGATAPLKAILRGLPADFSASIFIVLHIPARSLGILATVASAATNLPVHPAEHGMPIERGNIYLAVPDHHLILKRDRMVLGRGPRENMARPAIDPLFRSAAIAFGPRVVGVVLSGMLNDGAAGLEAIKRCGGIAIVQDPEDAIASEMPLSALAAVEADFAPKAARIGDLLADIAQQTAGNAVPIPPELQIEVDIAAGERVDSEVLTALADPSTLTCPQCGGVMSEVRGSKPLRYRCQVGHALTAEVLAKEQENTVDEALRVALRIIEERAELVHRMAEDGRKTGRRAVAEMYDERSVEYRRYADIIREAVLLKLPSNGPQIEEGGQHDADSED